CGKSTTGKCLIRLTDPTAGRILLEGADLAAMNSGQLRAMRRRMQFIFQDPFSSMNPRMRVRDIIGEPLRNFGYGREAIRERVAQLLARVSLRPDAADRYPHEFSGGQRQRVAIGRAVVREPKLFLFDEPLSNLDAALRVNTRLEIAQLHRRLKATMIYVTHDQVEAMTLADKIVVLNAGRIEQIGAPMELYHAPANEFVAGFIGTPAMNFLDVTVRKTDGWRLEVAEHDFAVSGHAFRLKDGMRAVLGIRPADFSL
ncbi:ABC transporter ATP-binding protein, partial [Acidovorax sp. ST3]|uniref:ABC transporter ATP-binding protein n=1 Tax=Acidovorax sp. ST3 TaxID=2219062 RepID=UPI00193CA2BA